MGTLVAEGKPHADFDGETYVQERGIVADIALVHAHTGDTGDTDGNLVYRYTARNLNPVVATAGKVTFAEVENLVEVGGIHPDHVVTPGVYVQHVARYSGTPKDIEQRTVRPRLVGAGAQQNGGRA